MSGAARREKLNVEFDFVVDGDEFRIFLDGRDVTYEVSELIGKEHFREIKRDCGPSGVDPYDVWVERSLEEGRL